MAVTAELFLPNGTVIGSLIRSPSGSSDSIPQLTQNNFEPASIALEIQSTEAALLLSRMTTAQRDALSPAHGMIIYNTETGFFEGYDNNDQWTAIGGGGGSITPVIVDSNTQMFSNFMYMVDAAGPVSLNLPSFPSLGDVIEILGVGAGLWTITQNTFDGTTIVRSGAVTSSMGFGGITAATAQGDGVRLIYVDSGLWQVNPAPQGNLVLL